MSVISSQKEKAILSTWHDFFLDLFNQKAITYQKKKYESFKFNPFTIKAAARSFGDNNDPENIAKALVYPFTLGSSLSTSFGTNVQKFISDGLNDIAEPSVTSGMDIEYVDAIDGRKKYCQLKAGPTTINKADIKSIEDDFTALKNLARTNHMNLNDSDYVVGVLYGTRDDLSTMYQTIYKDGYNVYAGSELWYHMTGSNTIYQKLINEAQKASNKSQMKDSIDQLIEKVKDGIINDPRF